MTKLITIVDNRNSMIDGKFTKRISVTELKHEQLLPVGVWVDVDSGTTIIISKEFIDYYAEILKTSA